MPQLGDCFIEYIITKYGFEMGNVICEYCGAVIPPEENYLRHFYWIIDDITFNNRDIGICKLKSK